MTAHRAVARYQPTPIDRSTTLLRTHASLIDQWARAISARTGVDADDLWSVGALALIDAVDRFDDSRGAKLQTFLAHRVRGAMLDEVRRFDRLPRRLRDDVSQVKRAQDALHARTHRAPTTPEIAAEANLGAAVVDQALRAATATDRNVADVADVAGDEPCLDDLLINRENAEAVATAMSSLPDRTQTILALRYVEELTLKDIAGILSVSEARICQLLQAAIKELRAKLR